MPLHADKTDFGHDRASSQNFEHAGFQLKSAKFESAMKRMTATRFNAANAIDPLPRRGRVRHRQRVTKCNEAWFSVVNADFETGPAVRLSRPSGSSNRPPFQPLLGDDAITSGSFCQIKRGSAAFDQLRR